MTSTNLGRAALKEILVANLGFESETVDDAWGSPLIDSGIDSIGVLELEAVLKRRFGVTLPEGAAELSPDQIYEYIHDAMRGES
jgi:acyl carrier protein